jgi:UDP-GlcNAc:undecaprenyl-phosphate GlcNAc-1-phosphate transferase
MHVIGPAVLAVSFLICLGLLPLARKIATVIGMVDKPGERKIHSEPIPYGGGLAVLLSCLLTVGVGLLAVWSIQKHGAGWLPAGMTKLVEEHVEGALGRLKMLAAIFAGGLMVAALGFADDIRSISYRVKFGVEILAGLILVLAGVKLTIFIDNWLISAVATVVWVVAVTNAFNLLDNMDGLSGGVAVIAGVLLLAVASQTHQVFVAALVLSLMGALLAFLIFNFPPASVFMGDAGSLFVGFMMASLTTVASYYEYQDGRGAFSVVMPILILGVPIYDTASVIIIRLRNGTPVFEGDMNHFSHRLVALGMTKRQAVLTIYLTTLAVGLAAILLPVLPLWGAIVVGLQAAAIVAVIVLLEIAGRKKVV